jgi:molybdopterin converting factor small subunit
VPDVRLPTILRSHAGGAATVTSAGATVAEVLEDLEVRYPGMAGQLRNGDGSMRKFVNVYVNDDDVRYLDQQDTKVGDGDEISILPAVAGGCGR